MRRVGALTVFQERFVRELDIYTGGDGGSPNPGGCRTSRGLRSRTNRPAIARTNARSHVSSMA